MLNEELIATICIAIVAPILGVAFPVFIDMISRLDDKYSSEMIIELFNKEHPKKLFLPILIASVSTFLLWLLNIPPFLKSSYLWINYTIEHSAILLVLTGTAITLTYFFWLLLKITLYYTPKTILPYLIKKHETSFINQDLSSFHAISDILFFSINNNNEKIAITASDFMYATFKSFREKHSSEEIAYPIDFYDMIGKAIEELAEQKNNKRIRFLAHRTAGSIWLLGEFQYYKISEITYSYIWNNLLLSLTHEKEDYVMYHWENAHQYTSTVLTRTRPNYPEQGFTPTNQTEINARKKEIERFHEFHIALGGLLLYKNEYNLINRIFHFSQSTPPQQYLLTETMNAVFQWFFYFSDPYGLRVPFMSHRYYFPGLEGTAADDTVVHFIVKYISLLFLRQYTVGEYYVYSAPLKVDIPTTQRDKRIWLDKISAFKAAVAKTLTNAPLLKATDLDFITEQWCKENKKVTPLEIFDNLNRDIKTAFEQAEINNNISPEKVKQLNATVNEILEETFDEYAALQNGNAIDDYNTRTLPGNYEIVKKETLSEDQSISPINFESSIATAISLRFKEVISILFLQLATVKYVLDIENISKAIQKLNITSGQYTIISFGVDNTIIHGQNQRKTPSPNISILHYPQYNYNAVGNSLFIFKTSDLPTIIFNEVTSAECTKYQLAKINEKFNIYSSVIDLNLNDSIRTQYAPNYTGEDLRKYAFINISFNIDFRAKKKIKIIQIQQSSMFQHTAIPNILSDIHPF